MHRIILDTDPGIDDALALFLALASPEEVQLEAITTVSGNVHVDLTTRNALALLELAGRTDIPVARGCDRPVVGRSAFAADVHGDNGLGGVELPEPRIQIVEKHAVDLIIEKVMDAPGEITLVPIGPLTNIAMAVRREPRLAERVRSVVLMGGALRVPGNITPAAEFNIYVDPEAAQVVLHAGWPLAMVSLDVTRQALLWREQVDTLAANGHPVTALIKRMHTYYTDVYGQGQRVQAIEMHDPLCLASVFRPDFITWQTAYVDVELVGTLTRGETVGFFKRPEEIEGTDPELAQQIHAPNAKVSMGVDSDGFANWYAERVGQAFS